MAEGRREGILFYSPQGPLTAGDLELLRAPGDSLSLLGLLPPKPVAIGEKWTPPSWVGQMLTDTEAASKADLNCTLASVDDGQARVTFEGTVEGATGGSSGKVGLHGSYLFDLKAQRLARAEMEQTEERSVGPVSPGMKVTAKAVVIRTPAADANGLSEETAAAVSARAARRLDAALLSRTLERRVPPRPDLVCFSAVGADRRPAADRAGNVRGAVQSRAGPPCQRGPARSRGAISKRHPHQSRPAAEID